MHRKTGITADCGKEIFEGDYLVDIITFENTGAITEDYSEVVFNKKTKEWCVDTSFAKDHSFLVPIRDFFGTNLKLKKKMERTKTLNYKCAEVDVVFEHQSDEPEKGIKEYVIIHEVNVGSVDIYGLLSSESIGELEVLVLK